MPGADLIWETWAPLRLKLFLWLAMRRRHWTANRRARHGLDTHENCLLCEQAPESIDHIVVSCSFAQKLWWQIRAAFRESSQLQHCNNILKWWQSMESTVDGELQARSRLHVCSGGLGVVERKDRRIFSRSRLLASIKHQAELWPVGAGWG